MSAGSGGRSDEDLVSLFDRVDNAGRWGADDELGTLNHITPDKRRAAAALVQTGEALSLARPLARRPPPVGPETIDHRLSYFEAPDNPLGVPANAGEYFGLDTHQPGLTHLDCVSHIGGYDGRVYNGRRFADVAAEEGLTHGSIYAQRDGIVTRGVLLDLPAALGIDWLEPSHAISASDLEAAERREEVRVETGDVLVVRAGVEAREAELGPTALSPGPGPDAIAWLHEREVAVYAGDAPERLDERGARILGLLPDAKDTDAAPPTRFPLALHQIGIPAMGLVLLDHCRVEELARACGRLRRYAFLFVAAPLALPGGTGSPVNPLAIL